MRLVVITLIAAAVVLAGELWGAFHPTPQNWGVHHYAFLPRIWLGGGLASALALIALFRYGFHRWRLGRGAATVAVLAGGALFWLARSRSSLMGDAFMWLEGIRQARFPWVHEPVAAYAGYFVNVGLGRPDPTVSYAILSVAVGMVYLALAVGISRVLAEGPRARWFLFALLAVSGWTRLFYGTAGSYSLLAAAGAGYLFVALRHLRGKASSVAVAVAGTIPFLIQISGLFLLPSVVFVLLRGPGGSGERSRRLSALVIPAAGILALVLAWRLTPIGIGPVLSSYFGDILPLSAGASLLVPYPLLSLHHLSDLLQEQLLLAPFAAFLLVLLAAGGLVAGRDRSVRFLLWAGLPGWIFSLFALHVLGAAREWDSFALFSIPLLLAAGRSTLAAVEGAPRRAGWIMGLLVGLTLFHSLPWIAIGASPVRSIRQFVALFRSESHASAAGRAQAFDDLGTVYLEFGDSERAIRSFEAAALLDTTSAYATCHLGSLLLSHGRTREAVNVLRRAVRLDPDYDYARFELGNAYREADRPDSALMAYREALELNGDFLQAAVNLAGVARRQGLPGEAEEVVRKMQERFPDDPLLLSSLARIELDRGDTLQAMTLFRKSLEADPDNADTAYNLGLVLLGARRPGEAAGYFERVVTTRPWDAEAWVNLGVAREVTGQTEEAMRAYRQAMAADPSRPEAYFNLFRVQLVAGDTTAAAAVLTQYAERDSTTGSGQLARTLLRGLGRPAP